MKFTPSLLFAGFSFIALLILLLISVLLGDSVHVIVIAGLLCVLSIGWRKNLFLERFYFLLPFFATFFVIGSFFDLYRKFDLYDKLTHVLAIFTVTYLLGSVFSNVLSVLYRRSPFVAFVVVICMGIAIGAWWEVFEWGVDFLLAHNLIEGAADTALDIVANSLGATLAAYFTLRLLQKDSSPLDKRK